MTDSSSSESGQEQSVDDNDAVVEPAPPPAMNGPLVNGEGEEPEPQEEERTLTDHLNKKLLESFLARLDSGSMQLPPGARGNDLPEEEENDFDDQ